LGQGGAARRRGSAPAAGGEAGGGGGGRWRPRAGRPGECVLRWRRSCFSSSSLADGGGAPPLPLLPRLHNSTATVHVRISPVMMGGRKLAAPVLNLIPVFSPMWWAGFDLSRRESASKMVPSSRELIICSEARFRRQVCRFPEWKPVILPLGRSCIVGVHASCSC
jgi:hypothetical protein